MTGGQTPLQFLRRHISGAWSGLSEIYAQENELSIQEGFRVLTSTYETAKGEKLWIITEADRSSTNILLRSEY